MISNKLNKLDEQNLADALNTCDKKVRRLVVAALRERCPDTKLYVDDNHHVIIVDFSQGFNF